jgi:large subunit ribosomal protein L6
MASHIGKLPITIPAGVEVKLDGDVVSVKGPKGSDSYTFPQGISATIEGDTVTVTAVDDQRQTRANHGLSRSIIASMVEGVNVGITKKLEIVGTGYRAAAKGQGLEFSLGYSHTITVNPPEGIKFTLESPTQITVEGIDKQLVGEVAANIRKLRAPEPYKGKGIKYVGEVIRRKAGKAGK